MATGVEWVVEAYGCSPSLLCDVARLDQLFAQVIADLNLHPCGDAQWTHFAGAGGVTGFRVLSESHLACHSFPEHRTLCLNLFCCRPRPDWDFARHLQEMVGAETVTVRRLERRIAADPA
ncbi:MAG TPA: S-adenosylmethionine decarboxylase [Vicinamibacterales bacterium]